MNNKKFPLSMTHPAMPYNGRYYKAVETKDFIFYCNYKEGDDNANTIMFRKDMTLVSNNYFANVGLMEALAKNEFTRISPYMKTVMAIPEFKEQLSEITE